MDFAIDHVTVAGCDLPRMQTELAAAGLESVYGGAHRDGLTEMAIASFADGSYLELIAPCPGADPQRLRHHPWSPFLRGPAEPCAWALRSGDLRAEAQRLKTAVSEPSPNGRDRPDGVPLEWATADLGSGLRGAFFPFLIQDFTPRELRAFPSGQPGNPAVRGVNRIVIAVRSLPAAIAQYRTAFSLGPAREQTDADFGAHVVSLDESPIVLAEPLNSHSWLAGRVSQFGEGPCAFVLGSTQVPGAVSAAWLDLEIRWLASGIGLIEG